MSATAANASRRSPDVRGRLHHRLNRRDDFALAVGAVLREAGEFRGRERDLFGAIGFERTSAFQHLWGHQDQRQQRQPRAKSKKLLEFDPFAVECNA
jgi:hypothetical protein